MSRKTKSEKPGVRWRQRSPDGSWGSRRQNGKSKSKCLGVTGKVGAPGFQPLQALSNSLTGELLLEASRSSATDFFQGDLSGRWRLLQPTVPRDESPECGPLRSSIPSWLA